jgi:hypothetical protein
MRYQTTPDGGVYIIREWHDNERTWNMRPGENTPLLYKLCYWMIFLAYMVITLYPSWPSMVKRFREDNKKCPSMEVAREKWGKAYDIQEKALKQIDSGDYTAIHFKTDVYILASLREDTDRFVLTGENPADSIISNIHEKFRKGYIEHFDVRKTPQWKAWGAKECFKRKEEIAWMGFDWDMKEAEARVRPPAGYYELDGRSLLRTIGWLFRRYALFWPFAIFILALQFRQRKKSLIEAVYIMPKSALNYIFFWPIGMMFFAEEYSEETRYRRLAKEYLAGRPARYRLSDEEEAALRLRARQPILSFETAMEIVKKSPELIVRQSRFAATVTALLWTLNAPAQLIQFVGVAFAGISSKQSVVVLHSDRSELGLSSEDSSGDGGNGFHNDEVQPIFPSRPTHGPELIYCGRISDTLGRCRIRKFLRQIQPRGPPRGEEKQTHLLPAKESEEEDA